MRFLDVDLDFFLNENAYRSVSDSGRLGSEYKPWSIPRVRHFLEYRCYLSLDAPVQGRTIESHDGVLDFWRTLIESGRLTVPFEVIHIDAHPDLWVGEGLSMTSERLHVDAKRGHAMLKRKHVHSGNYLTFAIAYGWIGSLVWIPLQQRLKAPPSWDADARAILIQQQKRKCENSLIRDSREITRIRGIHFQIIPWQRFKTSETFDFMALSRSPNFTPPESDRLLAGIQEYMKPI